jgi:hypothetical protein
VCPEISLSSGRRRRRHRGLFANISLLSMRLTPIQTANLNATVHKMDIESLEPEQREQLRQVLLAIKAQHDREVSLG